MDKIIEIMGTVHAQSFILLATVIVTGAIFFYQRKAEKRDAARIIVMQIDSINQKVDSLMRILGPDISVFDYNEVSI